MSQRQEKEQSVWFTEFPLKKYVQPGQWHGGRQRIGQRFDWERGQDKDRGEGEEEKEGEEEGG